jgi:hypothetical protein
MDLFHFFHKVIVTTIGNILITQYVISNDTVYQVLRCLRAAQMHLAGQMRPVGRVLETPAVYSQTRLQRTARNRPFLFGITARYNRVNL